MLKITEENGNLIIKSNTDIKSLYKILWKMLGLNLLYLAIYIFYLVKRDMSLYFYIGVGFSVFFISLPTALFGWLIFKGQNSASVVDVVEQTYKRERKKPIHFHTIKNFQTKALYNLQSGKIHSTLLFLIFVDGKVHYMGDYKDQLALDEYVNKMASAINVPVINSNVGQSELMGRKIIISEYALTKLKWGGFRGLKRMEMWDLSLVDEGTEDVLTLSKNRTDILKRAYQLAQQNQVDIYIELSEIRNPLGLHTKADRKATKELTETLKSDEGIYWYEDE